MKTLKKDSKLKKQVLAEKFDRILSTNKYVLFFHYNGSKECNWPQIRKKMLQNKPQNQHCKGLLVRSNLYKFSVEAGESAATLGDKRTQFPRVSRKSGVSRENSVLFAGQYCKIVNPANLANQEEKQLYNWKKVPLVGSTAFDPAKWDRSHFAGNVESWRFLTHGPTLIVTCFSAAQMVTLLEMCVPPTIICIGGLYNKQPLNHLDMKRWASLCKNVPHLYAQLLKPLMQWQQLLFSLQASYKFVNTPLHYVQRALLLVPLLDRKTP